MTKHVTKQMKERRKQIATEKFHLNILRERVIGVHPKYRHAQSKVMFSAQEWERRAKDFGKNPQAFLEHNGFVTVRVERI